MFTSVVVGQGGDDDLRGSFGSHFKAAAAEDLDGAGAKSQKIVHRGQHIIAKALALIVHGHHDAGGELRDDFCGLLGVDGLKSSHGDKENIRGADGGNLLLIQLAAQIAQMDTAHPLGGEDVDEVVAPLGTLSLVVEGGDGFHPDAVGLAGEDDHLGTAVVIVSVAAVDTVGLGADGAAAGDIVVGKGVDDHGALFGLESKAGMTVPDNFHKQIRSFSKKIKVKWKNNSEKINGQRRLFWNYTIIFCV